jgi:hypothetical protein
VQVENQQGHRNGKNAVAEGSEPLEVTALDAVIQRGHGDLFSLQKIKRHELAVFSQVKVGHGVLVAYLTRKLERGYHISGMMEFGLLAGLGVDCLAEVRVQEGEPLENALRRFKRKVQQEDIIKEVKRHSYYL